MNAPELNLYYYPECPFCQMVIDVIEQLQLKVIYSDIHQDPKAFKKLVDDTGRRTVPCLYIDGKPMHESRDIMNWLKQNASKLNKL